MPVDCNGNTLDTHSHMSEERSILVSEFVLAIYLIIIKQICYVLVLKFWIFETFFSFFFVCVNANVDPSGL